MRFEELKRGNISFTSFTLLDEEQLLEILSWRNHEAIRVKMNEVGIISKDDHLRFCRSLPNKENHRYWLVHRKNIACGVVTLNSLKDNFKKSEWGYYASPKFMGSGVGLEMAYEAIQIFFEKVGVLKLLGYVKESNLENLRLQKLIGFQVSGKTEKNGVPLVETVREDPLPEKEFKQFQKRVVYGR